MTHATDARPRTLLSTALGLALLLAALIALPSHALGKTQLGFTDDLPRITRAAPALQGTSKVVRIPIQWTGVRASGWGEVDSAVNAARASGQRVMLAVSGGAAPDLGEWASFLREAHARYPNLWAIQAWNEPNLEQIGGDLPVGKVVSLVRTARAVLPGVRLVGPSVSPTVPGASRYQARMYRALPSDIGLGVNIYTYRRRNLVEDVCAEYRKAKADAGKAKVYVTEFGFHGDYFPNQAAASATGLKLLRGQKAAAVLFYRLLANHASEAKWEQTGHFNVLNDDLSPRPILGALRKASTSRRTPKCPR